MRQSSCYNCKHKKELRGNDAYLTDMNLFVQHSLINLFKLHNFDPVYLNVHFCFTSYHRYRSINIRLERPSFQLIKNQNLPVIQQSSITAQQEWVQENQYFRIINQKGQIPVHKTTSSLDNN